MGRTILLAPADRSLGASLPRSQRLSLTFGQLPLYSKERSNLYSPSIQRRGENEILLQKHRLLCHVGAALVGLWPWWRWGPWHNSWHNPAT